jgi:hypothetical protein
MKEPDKIVRQEMLVKDEYYIWHYCTTIILLRFVTHHSEYDIRAKIIVYNGRMEYESEDENGIWSCRKYEDDIPQVLTTSGGRFYKLNNL